jgi:predicted metal-binding membrane protein
MALLKDHQAKRLRVFAEGGRSGVWMFGCLFVVFVGLLLLGVGVHKSCL